MPRVSLFPRSQSTENQPLDSSYAVFALRNFKGKHLPHNFESLDRSSISRMPVEDSVEARAAALRILERMRKKIQAGH